MRRRSTLVAIAVALALCAIAGWRWPQSVSKSGPAASAAAALAEPAGPAAALASAAASASPQRVGQGSMPLPDDPRCVIPEPAALAPADASSDASSPSRAPAIDVREQAARARLLARLQASPDPYANAVAVWLDVDVDSDDVDLTERQRRLAAMAKATQDPRLYSLALRTCWGRQSRPCDTGLSARRWSELEPANALPWLMMFDEAAENGDLSGMHEAMFHATQARRLADRFNAPMQPILDAAGTDLDSLLAARTLSLQAAGISAAQVGTRGYLACSKATSANANVWQQCLALADLMTQRSDSLLEESLGQRLHQRLTGEPRSARQVAALDRQFDLGRGFGSSSSCEDLRAKLAVMRRLAVEGEVAVARDLAR